MRRDAEAARRLVLRDDEVDELNRQMFAELIRRMIADPLQVERSMTPDALLFLEALNERYNGTTGQQGKQMKTDRIILALAIKDLRRRLQEEGIRV